MKKTILIVLAACLLLCAFAGCGDNGANEGKEYDLEALSKSLADSGAFSDILSPVKKEIASTLYGFDSADIEELSLSCSTGATTEEIGLFKCVDEAAAGRVLDRAQARIEAQKTAYESYAPGEIPKLDEAYVKSDGVFVFYIVSKDAAKVSEIMK